ncbi:MAG: hypothetical protein MR215_09690 [Bacteroidales bacterium]|nr:hypothetical protein [Bacteroidales bacterium]
MKRKKSLTITLLALLAAACLTACGTSQSWGKKKPRYGGCTAQAQYHHHISSNCATFRPHSS